LRLEVLGKLKNPMTASGIEPATFRLVTYCINQLRYRVPPWLRVASYYIVIDVSEDIHRRTTSRKAVIFIPSSRETEMFRTRVMVVKCKSPTMVAVWYSMMHAAKLKHFKQMNITNSFPPLVSLKVHSSVGISQVFTSENN
jgi:hypothetical protein